GREGSDEQPAVAIGGAAHARIFGPPWDEVVETDPESTRERDQEFQVGLALARLEARESARRHADVGGELLERELRRLPCGTQQSAHLFDVDVHVIPLLFSQTGLRLSFYRAGWGYGLESVGCDHRR